MPRHGHKRKWYHWIIKIRSDQEPDMTEGASRIDEAERARDEAERRYRQLTDRGGAVSRISSESAYLGRRNHFSEALEQMLKQGAERRSHGQ